MNAVMGISCNELNPPITSDVNVIVRVTGGIDDTNIPSSDILLANGWLSFSFPCRLRHPSSHSASQPAGHFYLHHLLHSLPKQASSSCRGALALFGNPCFPRHPHVSSPAVCSGAHSGCCSRSEESRKRYNGKQPIQSMLKDNLQPENKIHVRRGLAVTRTKKVLLSVLVLVLFFHWIRTLHTKEDEFNKYDVELEPSNNGMMPPPQIEQNEPQWFKGLRAPTCEEYTSYAARKHEPLSKGPLKLSYMRPPQHCRTFTSPAVEKVIESFRVKMKDPDLFRIFENALPNTLDTTILWFEENDQGTPKTFISTGDIHAEWLRDSAHQLSVYQRFIPQDEMLAKLIKGAIMQQAEYISIAPYCNAFQPPKKSKVSRKPSSIDNVTPVPPWSSVFECKYELDSLASFLTLTNEYLENSKDFHLLKDPDVENAFRVIARILKRESSPTFDPDGKVLPFFYSFRRDTNIGSETLPLGGTGNPVNYNSGLIRSAFRPSDDACIFQFLVPANAQMLVELQKIIPLLKKYNDPLVTDDTLSSIFQNYADNIARGIEEHAVIEHKMFGPVYAYEVDGYGGANFMDDANIPSLLSLPDMGYGTIDDPIYQNTRKMILSKEGNPYFLKGKYLKGIGGPHVGLFHAWPMSLLVQIRTSDEDVEILRLLDTVKKTTAGLGLMHEGVNVNSPSGKLYTRPWFSWCNSEFGKTILDLADRKPWLLFDEKKPDSKETL